MNCLFKDNYLKQMKCKEFKANLYGRCKFQHCCPLYDASDLEATTALDEFDVDEIHEMLEELSNFNIGGSL